MNYKTVLHFIKTKSILSDGRLLKWVDSLEAADIHSSIVVLEDENEESELIIGNSTKVEKIKLQSRKLFQKKGSGFFLKIPEYSFKSFRRFLSSKEDVVIFHDNQHYLTLMLLFIFKQFNKKKIIWDLHELPHSIFFKTYLTRKFLCKLYEKCHIVIHTNQQRYEFLHSKIKFTEKNHVILNNYPEIEYIQSVKKENSSTINDWLNGEQYILWLGAATKTRCFDTVFEAYKQYSKSYKLIILGAISEELEQLILINNLSTRIWSSYVNQSEIINFIDNASFSIVLYKNNSPNNLYCEPNRVYQLLSRKIPVIVGNNPRLSEMVKNKNFGIVLENDGSNSKSMLEAFDLMIQKHTYYKETLKNTKFETTFSWEQQFSNVLNCLKI
jgi:hypothetical protein